MSRSIVPPKPPSSSNKVNGLGDRQETFQILNRTIRRLQELYDEMPSEKIILMLRDAERLKEIWWIGEDHERNRELIELLDNASQFPHSVVSWVQEFRDSELE